MWHPTVVQNDSLNLQGFRAFDTETYFGVNFKSLDLCCTNKTCPTQTRMKTNAEPWQRTIKALACASMPLQSVVRVGAIGSWEKYINLLRQTAPIGIERANIALGAAAMTRYLRPEPQIQQLCVWKQICWYPSNSIIAWIDMNSINNNQTCGFVIQVAGCVYSK